jgi:hypothetical protein
MANSMNQDDDPIGRIVRQELEAADRLSPETEREERLAGMLDRAKMQSQRHNEFFVKWVHILAPIVIGLALVVVWVTLLSNGQTLGLHRYLEQQSATFRKASSAPPALVQRPDLQTSDHGVFVDGPAYRKLFLSRVPTEIRVPEKEPGPVLLAIPRMSFEETVRILYFDRSLEKFLLAYARKQKEV